MVRRRRRMPMRGGRGVHIDLGTMYRIIKNGIIITASIIAGVNGYIAGVRGIERLWPQLIEKFTLTRVAASVVAGKDEDYDY